METIDEQTGEVYEGEELTVLRPTEVSHLDKSEVEMQVDAAHKYPRSIRKFLSDAITLATIDEDTAQACIFSYKRGGKMITGPSIRCAEICISAWGNAHVGARIVAVEEKDIVAQGGAWDLEKNVKCVVETRRRITTSSGDRYSDDMIAITGNAAASIALRNAIFRIVPLAYVNQVYSAARKASVGNASTLSERRARVMDKLIKMGAPAERILAAVGKPSVDDLTVDDVETLIGFGTAIKSGAQTVDAAFPELAKPAAAAATDEPRRTMTLKGRAKPGSPETPPPETAPPAAEPPPG